MRIYPSNSSISKSHDDELAKNLELIKKEKAELKFRKFENEKELSDLLMELERKKEREIRTKIEKDEIRRALFDLEKTKLSALDIRDREEEGVREKLFVD